MREVQSPSIATLIGALVKAQANIGHALKDAQNGHFKSDYATLESVINATKAPLAEQGLVVIQQPDSDETGRLVLITTLAHTSGEWLRSFTPIMTEKQNAHGLGSGMTYSRRFALAALCNISQTDDDGNVASNHEQKTQAPKQTNHIQPSKQQKSAGQGGAFVITFGKKYKDMTIQEAVDKDGLPAMQKFVHWLEDEAKKQNKPLFQDAISLKANLSAYADELKLGEAWQNEEFS
jgi:hypothetical protein